MALRANSVAMVMAGALLLTAATGCPKQVSTTKPGPDPDTNSGPDAKRGGAKMMFINKPEIDSVSWPKLLRTKWKRLDINVEGTQPILACELRIDNVGADLNIDFFNSLGTQVAFSPGPAPNKIKQLPVEIKELGTYFVRIQAAKQTDESDFTVTCAWDVKPEAPVVAEGPKTPGKRRPKPDSPVAAKEETYEEKVEKGTEGRIVQNYREGDKTLLVIDKGQAAGVRTGTEGTVLAGKSGREPLAGGTLKVVKVLDDGRCQAETGAKALGKNNRVVLFLK